MNKRCSFLIVFGCLFLVCTFASDLFSGVSFNFLIEKSKTNYISAHFENLNGLSITEIDVDLEKTLQDPQFSLVVSTNVSTVLSITLTFHPLKLEDEESYLFYEVGVLENDASSFVAGPFNVVSTAGSNSITFEERSVTGLLTEIRYPFTLKFNPLSVDALAQGLYTGLIEVEFLGI